MTRGRLSRDDRAKPGHWRVAKRLNERRQIMTTNYANEKLTTAIKNHLLSVDAIPRNAEASKLAGDLAQVCLRVLY